MSEFGKEGYLRVLTPQTTDGKNVRYNSKHEVVLKESHVRNTATAKKALELENDSLPDHLKHRIEIVPPEEEAPEGEVKTRNKPGPKPKVKEPEET